MITEKDLQEAIAECHGVRNPNADTCAKLASYYIIQDHMGPRTEGVPSYSYASRPTESASYNSGSEFSQVIKHKDMTDVLAVMDELMETLHIINPRLYNGVMARLMP